LAEAKSLFLKEDETKKLCEKKYKAAAKGELGEKKTFQGEKGGLPALARSFEVLSRKNGKKNRTETWKSGSEDMARRRQRVREARENSQEKG